MFSFNYDRRMLYIILAIFILMNISSYLTNQGKLLGLLLTLPAVLIAITFHEFAHAYAADKLGDDTPRRQGRLNLHPLSHLDPIGSVMLVFAGFGWVKPVEINPRNFNRDRSMSASEAIVSVAGPLMNFVLAIVFAIILGVTLIATNSYIQMTSYTMSIVTSSQLVFVIIQMLMACISVNSLYSLDPGLFFNAG